jgi:hypothetical protein
MIKVAKMKIWVCSRKFDDPNACLDLEVWLKMTCNFGRREGEEFGQDSGKRVVNECF